MSDTTAKDQPSLDDLGRELVEAVFKAEREPALSASAQRAWREVGRLEELLANHPDATESSRFNAQCGVIRAAKSARDFARARELTNSYHLTQSPSASERHELHLLGNERIPGFPYAEGLPRERIAEYTIVLGDGRRLLATLDLSRQHAAEGIQWYTAEGIFPQTAIAAWWSRKLDGPL